MNLFNCRFTCIVIPVILFVSVSCDEDNALRNNVQWEKIRFDDEVAVNAIYGDLNDYMLVSTLSKVLRTNDGGKSWEVVLQVNESIAEFHDLNDDIYATSNFQDYVSHDEGQTWQGLEFDHELNPPSASFNDSKGNLYQLVHHYNGELALPTTFLRSNNNGNSWEVIFPHEHGIQAWHIDGHDRIYLGTSGALWDGQSFIDDPQLSAYLFYTK